MPSLKIQALSLLRVLVEVPLFAFIGQGLLALLAGRRRQENPIYRLFGIVTAPVLRCLRPFVSKGFATGRLSFLAFALLFLLWILLAYVKRGLCGIDGLVC